MLEGQYFSIETVNSFWKLALDDPNFRKNDAMKEEEILLPLKMRRALM